MKRRDFTSLLTLSTLGFAMTSKKQLSNWSSHLQKTKAISVLFIGHGNPMNAIEEFEQQYPAPGWPELASDIKNLITSKLIHEDHEWGLDHGTWTVLKHLYPAANIPVVQFSIDYQLSLEQHFELATQLQTLRERGVLIIGSGNIVNNLRPVGR
jgi:aromatic ring-opening dioxygenase catalytic subunit (LigB family)